MDRTSHSLPAISTAEIKLLTEVGFMACGAGNIAAAQVIFHGLRAARANSGSALIGLAMSFLESGSPQEAVNLLRGAYSDYADGDANYKVFFGLCLISAGLHHEAEKILNDLLGTVDGSCQARELAAALIRTCFTDGHIVMANQEPAGNSALNYSMHIE